MSRDPHAERLADLHRLLYDLEAFLKEQHALAEAVHHPSDAAVLQRALALASAAHMLSHTLGAAGDDEA